ncbi:MAG TPA: tetratricopeptide repeat protein [Anaerohalosphaeraceae bacterium]|nr:tetratricopeptide repeat protein [Anaerohalosphaeraceae bacterium]
MTPVKTEDLLEAAAQQAAAGNYQTATALLDRIQQTPPPLEALLLRGKIAAQQKQYKEAISFWQQALRQDPNCRTARESIALAGGLSAHALAGRLRHISFAALLTILLAVLLAFPFGLGIYLAVRLNTFPLLNQLETLQTDWAALQTAAENIEQKLIETQGRLASLQQTNGESRQTLEQQNEHLILLVKHLQDELVLQSTGQERIQQLLEQTQTQFLAYQTAFQQSMNHILLLSVEIEQTADYYRQIEKRWFGPSPAQHQKMREHLEKIKEQINYLRSICSESEASEGKGSKE